VLLMPRKRASTCAGRLKVLSDTTRLAVLELLMKGPKHVGAIGKKLKIGQSLLSHHLQVLRKAGLVEGKRDGKAVLYRLSSNVEGAKAGRAIDLGCCLLSFE
jgi:DNA-binding transcriptional ArsR family regulator